MRKLSLCAFSTVLIFALQPNASGDIISDFVTLGTGTPISANNGSNSNATTLNDLTAGNEASEATVSRTFTNNATFGSFVIDFKITASTAVSAANIGVDFGTSNNGIGVGTDRNIGPGERLEFEISGINLSSLNAGFSVTGYGIESIRFVAANADLDSGVVTWDEGLTGGSLGNVTPAGEVQFLDMNDGSGGEEAYIFEDGSSLFTWDFSQDDTNGSGMVTNRVHVVNNGNLDSWYLNRVNLLADVKAVPEPSALSLGVLAAFGLLGYHWQRGRKRKQAM